MRNRRTLALAGVLALVVSTALGCVSNKSFKRNVADTDGRIAAVESAVEANDNEIEGLKQDTATRIDSVQQTANEAGSVGNQALTKANEARKAADGKLLWSVALSDDRIKFSTGRAELSEEAKRALDQLVAKVKSYGKALYIEVEGHTDSVGTENLNLRLSEKRAGAVLNYLNQSGGIPLHAMNTIAMGESQPVADNSDKDGRAQNRRVVIRVLE